MLMKIKDLITRNIVLHKSYNSIYLIYFFFFVSSGPLQNILSFFYFNYFSGMEWGIFLSINNFVSVFIPTLTVSLCLNKDIFKVASFGVIISSLGGVLIGLFGSNNLVLLYLGSLFLFSGRIVFNNSYGNYINYKISNLNLGSFLAMRDIYLYGGISLGSLICGMFIKYFGYNVMFLLISFGFIFVLIMLNRNEKGNSVNTVNSGNSSINVKEKFKYLFNNKIILVISFIYFTGAFYSSSYNFVGKIGLDLGVSASTLISFSGIIVLINAFLSLIISSSINPKKRKYFFVFDIFFDAFPAFIFAISKNPNLFMFAYFLSLIKDVLSPISFAYIISCFSDQEGMLALGLLGSISSLMNIIFPSLIGFLWDKYFTQILIISAILCILTSILSFFAMPNTSEA